MYVLDNVSRKPHRSVFFNFEIASTLYGLKFEESSEFGPLAVKISDKVQNSLVCSPPLIITFITQASLKYLQELGTFLAPQSRTQGRCGKHIWELPR